MPRHPLTPSLLVTFVSPMRVCYHFFMIKQSYVRTSSLLCLIFLATSLQFWALDAQSLWYDEGFSVWLSEKSLSEIVALTAADIQPPLYYLLLHGWIKLVGKSEFALRFLSA